MINLTIDNKKVQGQEGQTVLQVAEANGIHIPTLCYMEGVHENFSCRICVVEVEGMRNLQPSCSVKAAEGMVVRTNNEKVLSARRTIVNLMLSNGAHNCLSCEKNGDCQLQDAAYELGIEAPKFILKSENDPGIDDSSPMIIRDNRKCILCKRCVIACNKIVDNDVLGLAQRGSETVVVCDTDKPMGESSCVQCGECVQRCPVGALIEKKSVGKARSWETTKVRTTCPYCGVGCQLNLHMKGEEIVKVTGVEGAQPNDGRLCVKGRFGYDFIYSDERLTTPLIKQADGTFREASWDEALDLVANKFKAIIAKYGPEAVAGVSCARSTNENSYQMQKLVRAVFQSPNIDHCARVCHAPTVSGLMKSFGTGGMTNSIQEFANTKLLFCIGTNMTEAHPVASTFVKNGARNGAKLIVCDPRRHRLADYADIFAQMKVGSDVAFLNAIMNVLINEDLYDKEFVRDHCENFEELKACVMKYPPERGEEISGVPKETIIEIARMLGTVKPAMLIYTLGITEHTCGTDNVISVANLQMLLGNIGKENTGVNPLRGQNNVQGACDMGALPNVLPGYQSFTDPAVNAKFAKAWGVDSIPAKNGLMIAQMLDGLLDKTIRGLFLFGENLVQAEPDIAHVEKCMAAAEFLVSTDIFMTETTRFAHVILPAASWCEDEGTYTNCERRISRVRKIKNAPGEAKPDWWIFKQIAKRFGHEWASNSAREIWDNELAVLCPSFAGVKYYRLDGDGIQWPCPSEDHPGTQILHKDGNFTRGKGLLVPLEWTPPAEVPDAEYPFVLSTGRRLYHYHTRTQTGRAKGLNDLLPEEYADISDIDAGRMGIADGEKIRVWSRRGSVEVTARVSERIQPGLVWMAFHYREGNANWLTNKAYDRVTMTPEYKACAVNISKL
ncbi:formate dehydrogenase major subunit [Sporobacter termitidis DSM 10068]|uniref:Formate dehydrogenase major subunit n=1 Tax=Sporobacter termitidis DSM 10068 TaxID=1123282 RepID=A0A1M5TXT9_9FIRM|nr:formate dehydrogenase subunit alpha [Sporobacter termitidis]SHH55508.1 formate dehydrogenase major subunit [Sporobacter termitidis DSM 10068]